MEGGGEVGRVGSGIRTSAERAQRLRSDVPAHEGVFVDHLLTTSPLLLLALSHDKAHGLWSNSRDSRS